MNSSKEIIAKNWEMYFKMLENDQHVLIKIEGELVAHLVLVYGLDPYVNIDAIALHKWVDLNIDAKLRNKAHFVCQEYLQKLDHQCYHVSIVSNNYRSFKHFI